MYRFVLFSSESRPVFRTPPPGEVSEIQTITELASALRYALAEGEREKAEQFSLEINYAIVSLLLRDNETNRFSGTAYLQLLLVFLLFMALTAIAVRIHYKALLRSMAREEENSSYTQAFLLAQEEERGRISRELHDTVAQDLRYLTLGMEKIGTTDDKAQRMKLCEEAASVQSGLIRRVRDICDNLVPPDFRFQGLPDALRRLCLDFKTRSHSETSGAGIDCRIEIAKDVNLKFPDEEKQLQIFRIVQEALNNVEKHAKAKEAIVILRSNAEGDVFIGISDDGIGFEPAALAATDDDKQTGGKISRLGIKSMTKRAALLGGSLKIKSEKGEGTLVCLEIPVKENKDGSIIN
jgi:signal transduction histidine kinase